MRRLIPYVLLVAVGLIAWKTIPGLLERRPRHEAVIENRTGAVLEDLQLKIGGQTFAADSVANDGSVSFRFLIRNDSPFEIRWNWTARPGSGYWKGGVVPAGPLVQRHVLTIDEHGGVVYRRERLDAAPARNTKRRA
jgi:hypothetical protein